MSSRPSYTLVALALAIQTLSAQSYEVKALRDVMVPARDGIKLGTNVFRPARDGSVVPGRFPTIVERTVYNKDGIAKSLIEYFVSRGYAVVIQDVRGRYLQKDAGPPTGMTAGTAATC